MTAAIFFKKLWVWLKNYWYIPVIIVLIVLVWIFTQKSPDALINILKNSRDTSKKEVDILNKIHSDEIKKREEALETYHKTIETVEKTYAEQNKKLDAKKKKQIKKIVDESAGDPEALTKLLADKMGFEVVRPEE